MAPFLLLVILLSEAASDQIVVRELGDDVTLPCQAADSSISVVEWTRPDLKPDIVLLYSDGHLNTYDQNPSFKDRVELVDRELKDRDVSLTLRNVNNIDTGTYKCGVKTGDTGRTKRHTDSEPTRIIRTVHLQVPDQIVVREPGDDVTLPCQAADSSIRAVEWSRPDLEPDIVLFYSDGHLNTDDQNPSFKGRVELVDGELKNGDMSLTLKNVSRHDAGIYECRVKTGNSTRKKRDIDPIRTIRTVRLQVPGPAGSEDRNSSPGGLYVGLAAAVLVLVAVVAVVVGVLIYKRRETTRPGPPAAAAADDEASALTA